LSFLTGFEKYDIYLLLRINDRRPEYAPRSHDGRFHPHIALDDSLKAWFRTGHGAVEKTVGITWEKETEDIFSLTSLSLTLWAPPRSNAYRTKAVDAERRAREKDCR